MSILILNLHSFSYFGNWGERLKSIYLIYRELIILSYMVIIFHTTWWSIVGIYLSKELVQNRRWDSTKVHCPSSVKYLLNSNAIWFVIGCEHLYRRLWWIAIISEWCRNYSYIHGIIAIIDWHTDTLMLLHSIALAHYLSIELNHFILLMIATCI